MQTEGTHALAKTNATSLSFAAFAAALRSFDSDVVSVAAPAFSDVSASTGGIMNSREFDPEPQPTDIVPSLHSFRSLQLRFGSLASCPIMAMVRMRDLVMGRPRIVSSAVEEAPVETVVRLFLRSTAEAEAISRTRAVCASERTETCRFFEPEPSECWASKFTAGKPCKAREHQSDQAHAAEKEVQSEGGNGRRGTHGILSEVIPSRQHASHHLVEPLQRRTSSVHKYTQMKVARFNTTYIGRYVAVVDSRLEARYEVVKVAATWIDDLLKANTPLDEEKVDIPMTIQSPGCSMSSPAFTTSFAVSWVAPQSLTTKPVVITAISWHRSGDGRQGRGGRRETHL